MQSRQRSIWFALLTLLLVSLYRTSKKYGKLLFSRVKGAQPDSTGK